MKRSLIIVVFCFLFSALKAQELKTYTDSVSYAVGLLWGQNVKQQGLTDIDANIIGKAIGDVLQDAKPQLDIRTASQLIKEHINREQAAKKSKNEAEGKAFLAKNADRQGVITLESGLQYEVITEGTGAVPTSSDKVSVHYTGTLINGDVFDSSVQRGQPASFPVTGVIKGWVEALQLMPVGSKWKLFIPADLAYGERGSGPKIGPNSTLIFEVELLGIE